MTRPDPTSYDQWCAMQNARRKRALQLDVALASFIVTVVLVVVFLFARSLHNLPEHEPYRCEDRGGVQQAVATRSGSITSVVCKDGTVHDAERVRRP